MTTPKDTSTPHDAWAETLDRGGLHTFPKQSMVCPCTQLASLAVGSNAPVSRAGHEPAGWRASYRSRTQSRDLLEAVLMLCWIAAAAASPQHKMEKLQMGNLPSHPLLERATPLAWLLTLG